MMIEVKKMKYLFRYLKKEPVKVGIVIILTIITSALRVTHALINVNILNALIKLQLHNFFNWVMIDIGVFAILSIFLILLQIQTAKTIEFLCLDLRKDIVRQIANKPIMKYQEKDTGVYASWLTNDMNTIENNGFYNILQSIQVITDPLFSIIALLQFSWTFIPLILLVSFLTVFLPQIVHDRLASASLSTTQANENLLSTINDGLRGFATYSIFGVERQLENRITSATMTLIGKKVRQAKYQAVANNIAGFSNILGQTGIEAWTGFLALQKSISIGVIGSSGNLSYNVFNSLAAIAPMWAEMTALTPIFEKYHLDDKNKPKQTGRTLENNDFQCLDIENLQISFGDKPVFKQPLNLHISKNQKIALDGDSGSGKSTLLKIISGQIKNYQGSVKINNQDEKTLSYDAIRETLIYVDQIPYLFNGTIRYNLELGEHFSDQEIFDALRKANLLDYVKELPAGLNTKVGENGTKMSGGQKQRLALARGLLRNRKLFLLDESTSSLDKKSALNVENIFLSQPDITVIFVSHQLHDENKQKFDRIIKI